MCFVCICDILVVLSVFFLPRASLNKIGRYHRTVAGGEGEGGHLSFPGVFQSWSAAALKVMKVAQLGYPTVGYFTTVVEERAGDDSLTRRAQGAGAGARVGGGERRGGVTTNFLWEEYDTLTHKLIARNATHGSSCCRFPPEI